MSVQTAPKTGWREWLKGDNYTLHKLHSLTGIFPCRLLPCAAPLFQLLRRDGTSIFQRHCLLLQSNPA
jgi:hypothetical protein